MQIDLSGKTAIVTGSTRGIGFAIAKGLAQAGATVVINGRSAPSVDKAVSLLQQYVPDATLRGVVADVGSVDGCAVLKAAEPEVDILVNNTGIYGPRDFFETGDDIWTEFFEVNVMSGVRLSRGYLPGMVSRQWGRVIFISSESALNIPADMIHYGFTKTANLSVARGLAKRMAGTGVTVNSILPGPTLSEGVAEMLKEASERTGQTLEEVAADFVRENRPSSILQRAATTEEVANLVVYTASPLASAATGAALRVDGGIVDTIA